MIWNERASPSALRRYIGSVVMSLPAKWMRPESGVSWPLSWSDQRGLAGAVRPDHRVQLAGLDVEHDIVGGDDALEALGQVTDLQQRLAHVRTLAPTLASRPIDAAAREQHDQQQQRAHE